MLHTRVLPHARLPYLLFFKLTKFFAGFLVELAQMPVVPVLGIIPRYPLAVFRPGLGFQVRRV